jgi:deoxyadenosine/deoxycytidine kinase
MYVAICGNSGAGKSTLGEHLVHRLRRFLEAEYVDEKEFHHRYLQRMFDQPTEYAFLIQTNFLLQRTLRIKHSEEQGRVFLIERSLSEDFIFACRHAESGAIPTGQFDVYRNLWKQCHATIPEPVGYIYLSCDNAALLSSRVIDGHRANRRNQELPDDALQEYIEDLNIRYEEWFEGLQAKKIQIPVFTAGFDNSNNFEKILHFAHDCLLEKE